MTELQFQHVSCPYCGESFETGIDASAGSQAYIEDCQICCRPIEFSLELDSSGGVQVIIRRDDE